MILFENQKCFENQIWKNVDKIPIFGKWKKMKMKKFRIWIFFHRFFSKFSLFWNVPPLRFPSFSQPPDLLERAFTDRWQRPWLLQCSPEGDQPSGGAARACLVPVWAVGDAGPVVGRRWIWRTWLTCLLWLARRRGACTVHTGRLFVNKVRYFRYCRSLGIS